MRIQHNIAALNSYRNLTNNNSAVSKNLEKLSSGYRINRAGDDAAGLAISEKMRAQITGLNTAQKNANDGISLVQTAEGALTEVHSMLNRMVELANQSANGTYANAPDRANLQAEIKSLNEEIDRISKATNFNGINLLDGTLGMNGDAFEIGASTAAKTAQTIDGTDSTLAVTKTHADKKDPQKAPEFTIDFADLKVTVPGATGTTAGSAAVTLSIGTKTATDIKFYDNTNNLGTESTSIQFTQAAGADSVSQGATANKVASDVADLFNGKYAVIGTDVYKMDTTDTKVKFTYAGQKGAGNAFIDKTAAGGEVQPNPWVPTGNVTVSFGGTGVTTSNRDNCHLTEVIDPVAGGNPIRAGAKLTLTDDIINRGSLTIGNKTFTFNSSKTAAEVTAGGTEIGTKGLTGSALYQSITQQMSKYTGDITIKDSNGTGHAFTIGRGNNASTIEIEEKVLGDPTKYGNFSEVELQKAFTQQQGQANACTELTLKANPSVGDSIKIGNNTYTFGEGDGKVAIGATKENSAAQLKAAIEADGLTVALTGSKLTISAANATDKAPVVGSAGLTLQIGDTSQDFNRMTVDVRSMSSASLGIHDIDISTQGGAQEAVDKIKAAINTVSSQRGDLGAIQNRLEHTINNLSVTAENMTAAESRIRDVDMAEEMMAYTKNNILVQAAQAMLAQANQVPQGVLQLLQ